MTDEMDEIIAEFITEAEESLDKIDPLFVDLETKGYDKDILNDIFRSMHTIKGAAGFLGFQPVVAVAHSSENILKKLRDGEIPITRQLMNAVLRSVDMLRLLLRHIKDKDGGEEDTASVLKELDMALKNAQPHVSEEIMQQPCLEDGGKDKEEQAPSAQGDVSQPSCDEAVTAPDAFGVGLRSEKENNAPERKESVQTLRVGIDKIDKVVDLTGEVVLVRNRLLNIVNSLEKKESSDTNIENLFETVSFLDLITTDIHRSVMKMRKQPFQKVLSKFPRLVRDLSNSMGKDVTLSTSGEDTEVDKSVIEHIGDPLVHIIRNSIDHGLEPADERISRGKQGKGTISISACQKGNQIVIEVSDDGRGIDVERVKRKAIEKALITEEESMKMSEETAINLIFLPGFSTAAVQTELSGRGVGMDVVKTNMSKLGGYVEVKTKKGLGTSFIINIPLTLAIIQALMVRAGTPHFAIPLASVEETLRVLKKDIASVGGRSIMNIRDKLYPVFELSNLLGNGNGKRTDLEHRYAVIIP